MEHSGAHHRAGEIGLSRPTPQQRLMWYHDVKRTGHWPEVLWRVGELHSIQWSEGYVASHDIEFDLCREHGQTWRRSAPRYVYAPERRSAHHCAPLGFLLADVHIAK